MTMEGYIDLLINGFLNAYTNDTSTNGEVLGFMIAMLSIFLTTNFLPIALSWAIFSKNES
jgi:N-acetylglucosamine-6-phosphate deacetylase